MSSTWGDWVVVQGSRAGPMVGRLSCALLDNCIDRGGERSRWCWLCETPGLNKIAV